MGIFVAGAALAVEIPEYGAAENLPLARLVALDAFDLGVFAGQMEIRISIVVEGQFLAVPVVGRVARFARVAQSGFVRVLVAVEALRKFDLRVKRNVEVDGSFPVALVALHIEMLALQFVGGTVMVELFFVQRDNRSRRSWMFLMTFPARLFERGVIANFVFHASSDCLMAIETFSIRKLAGQIMTYRAFVGYFFYLMGLGKFVRRYHQVKFLGNRYLGPKIDLRSGTAQDKKAG
jgi:energy-converting hydrogenase Eha subunit A